MKPVLLSFVGRKGSGKAQVIENLITALKGRGHRIGLIKHLAKPGVEIDLPGKDTYRYRQCGAGTVILSGRTQLAVFSDLSEEIPLEKLLTLFENCGVVFLEGYFLDSVMKVEVHRGALGNPLTLGMENVLAVLSDTVTPVPATHFDYSQIPHLSFWIENWLINQGAGAGDRKEEAYV